MLISVVGKSGCGKSLFSKTLASFNENILHIDVDKISHKILTYPEVQEKLVKAFGSEVVEEKEVRRKTLGQIVFSSKEAMEKLTEITWSSIEKELDKIIEINKTKVIILDWLLLPKTKYFNQSNLKILITASLEQRIKLAVKRDKISKEYYIKRDNAGIDFNEVDYDVIIESINPEQLRKEASDIYEKSIISREF